jgi:hypothetical protein
VINAKKMVIPNNTTIGTMKTQTTDGRKKKGIVE